MIYYKGIVGHYTIVLKFHRSLGKNGKNILNGKYQQEGIKNEKVLHLCDTHYNIHVLMIFFILSSPLVHVSKWWLSVKYK